MNLQSSGLFCDLEEERIDLITSRFRKTSYRKNELVCCEKDPATSFLILTIGEAAVLQGSGSHQRELRRLSPGDSFGEIAIVCDAAHGATLKAVSDIQCLVMDREAFLDLLSDDAVFAHRMLRVLIDHFGRLHETPGLDSAGTQQSLIFSIGKLAEPRDPDIVPHLNRVRDYCAVLSARLSKRPDFKDEITPEFIENIYSISPLHDIGKVVTPESILMKAGKLTTEEFGVIKDHTRAGAEALQAVLHTADSDMLRMGYNMIMWHHENFDGYGYPDGLYGSQIPLEARIMAIADVYDAMVSRRIYKPPYGRDETYWAIQHLAGKKFDPVIAETMLGCISNFESIYQQYS